MEKLPHKKLKVHPCLKTGLNTSVKEIAKILKKEGERRIFIVDKDDVLKGIVTTTDLVYKVLAQDKTNVTAKDIMTKKVSVVDIEDPIEKALGVMNSHKTFVCPVVEKGKLKGVLPYHEIINYVFSANEQVE